MRTLCWAALLVIGCRSSSNKTERHRTVAVQDGGAIDLAAFDQVALAVDDGDGWRDAVTRLAAIAGPPNAVDGDRLIWAVLGADHCTDVRLTPDGAYVKAIKIRRLYQAGDDYQPCVERAGARAALPARLPEPVALTLDGPVLAVMTAWRDGAFQQLYDQAHPALREEIGPHDLAHLAALFAPVTGRFVRLDGPVTTAIKHFGYAATVPAVFERGTVTVALGFRIVDGTPALTDFTLRLPPELQIHPAPADAEALGRRALTALLGGRLAAVSDLAGPTLAKRIRAQPALEAQLAALIRGLGEVRSIELRERRTCAGDQCLSYAVVAAEGTATATFTARFAVSRWELDAFNLTPDE